MARKKSEKILLCYATCASAREAERIGEAAVRKRLAACANVVSGVKSVFFWKGKLVKVSEALLLLKTGSDCVKRLASLVKKMHSYESPCIVFYEAAGWDAGFGKWVFGSVKR